MQSLISDIVNLGIEVTIKKEIINSETLTVYDVNTLAKNRLWLAEESKDVFVGYSEEDEYQDITDINMVVNAVEDCMCGIKQANSLWLNIIKNSDTINHEEPKRNYSN